MSLWLRVRRLFRLHAGGARDPDAAMDALYEDVGLRLAEGRAEVAACEGDARRLAEQAAEAAGLAEEMLTLARRALALRREAWAREAVVRHLRAHRQAGYYAEAWQRQRADADQLRRTVELLEAQLDELERRRTVLRTRRTLARTQRQLLQDLYGAPAREALARAEDQALGEALATDAYGALVTDRLADDLEALAEADPVERTLARLKAEQSSPPREGAT